MRAEISELAARFARALDREDYDVVRALLAPNCHYDAPDGPIEGADEIVDSYRSSGRMARLLFDTVEFESELLRTAAGTADVSFSDVLIQSGRKHVYRCEQRLHFSPGGLVRSITHEELPGEWERLREFCAACGVVLPDARQ